MRDRGLRWLRLPSGAAALIDPSRGGTVHRLRFSGDLPGKPIEMLWGDDDPTEGATEPDLFRGRPLIPFADRIVDGTYAWQGKEYHLPGNDNGTQDAIHGFLYRTSLTDEPEAADRAEASMTLVGELPGRPGYPWPLSVRLHYALSDREFAFHLRVRNTGSEVAPLSLGWHPYFLVPAAPIGTPIDTAILEIPADRYLVVDSRLRPTGEIRNVVGTPYDFRTGVPLGTITLDIPLVMNVPGPAGRYEPTGGTEHSGGAGDVRLISSHHETHLRMGGAFRMVQLFTPPGRAAIAIEPVSAPAECFHRPGLGVIALRPGASVDAWVTVSVTTTPYG